MAGSSYMEWVKTQTGGVRFNLANSGVKSYALADLGVDFSQFELSGPGAYGYPPLKRAIAAKYGVSETCVTTALGTSGANWLTMAATLNPGDEVLMEHPAYPLLWETAEYLGAKVKFFERSEGVPVLGVNTRLIVLTNLHNPTCALMKDRELVEIGELAEQIGARVLVDEVYLDLVPERVAQSAFHLGERFISTNSLTEGLWAKRTSLWLGVGRRKADAENAALE